LSILSLTDTGGSVIDQIVHKQPIQSELSVVVWFHCRTDRTDKNEDRYSCRHCGKCVTRWSRSTLLLYVGPG